MKDANFKKSFFQIFGRGDFDLPRPNTNDYQTALYKLLEKYIEECDHSSLDEANKKTISIVCSKLRESIEHYYNGMPHEAFESFKSLMENFYSRPLISSSESSTYGAGQINSNIKLFRVSGYEGIKSINRKRIFHVPYNMRLRIKNNRYSISGYPCLYLGSSIELCCRESRLENHQEYIASQFSVDQEKIFKVFVMDLSVTPQFIKEFASDAVSYDITYKNYFIWYPLVAACSFVRAENTDFIPEYVVPQLLLQWLRTIYATGKIPGNRLIGISYFSCAATYPVKGTNYVFPTSGKEHHLAKGYCSSLCKIFNVSEPISRQFEDEDNYDWFVSKYPKKIYESD